MRKFTSMQEMVDCGLNAWAFTLVAESYLRIMEKLGDRITPEQKPMQVTMKGVRLTLEPAPHEPAVDTQASVELTLEKVTP